MGYSNPVLRFRAHPLPAAKTTVKDSELNLKSVSAVGKPAMFDTHVPDSLETVPVHGSHQTLPLREVALRLKLAHERGGADPERAIHLADELRRLREESETVGDEKLAKVVEPLEQSAVEVARAAAASAGGGH